jgi:hypothetical protein
VGLLTLKFLFRHFCSLLIASLFKFAPLTL